MEHLTAGLLNFADDTSGISPRIGFVKELAINDSIRNCIFTRQIRQFGVQSLSKSSQHRIFLEPDDVRSAVRFKQAVEFICGKTAVSPCKEGCLRIFSLIFLQKRQHKRGCALAAILRSRTQFDLQQISGQPVEAKQRMITMGLVVIVESFTFLRAIGSQQGGVQIKQNVLRFLDGVDSSAENPLYLFQLL